MLHAAGRRLEDLRELRGEQEVLGELGLRALPDAGTVGDRPRRQGRQGAEAIQQVSRRLVEACLQSEPEEVILVGASVETAGAAAAILGYFDVA
jgi:hypothetical protein